MGPLHRSFSTNVMAESGAVDQLRSADVDDKVEMIRRQFEEAKRSFLDIPAALKEMPKMNPEGLLILHLISILFYFCWEEDIKAS